MPVNLLPQTPPQTHADARATSKTEDAGNDAPTFSATLIAAATAATDKLAHANATRGREASEPARDVKPERLLTPEDLAALLLPGTSAVPVETALPNAPLAPVATPADTADAAPRKGPSVSPVAETAIPVAMPLVVLPGATAMTTAASALDRETATPNLTDALAHRPESRTAARADAERVPVEAAAPETTESTNSATLAKLANEAVAKLAPSRAEPKATHPADLLSSSAPSDARAVTAPPPAPPPVQITIAAPAFTPAWRDEVTQQIAQLVVMRHDRAEIRLHPADLGPISVKIEIEGGQANLLIQAPQAATRDGLELVLPHLRDSLAQQGITLGETSIRDQRSQNAGSDDRALPYPRASITAEPVSVDAPVRVRLGLIDLFA